MTPTRFGILAAIAAAVAVAVLAFVIGRMWVWVGPSEISLAGWLAMAFGIIATLALGIGLMALVFISNRRGYDDPGRRDGD